MPFWKGVDALSFPDYVPCNEVASREKEHMIFRPSEAIVGHLGAL